MVTENEGAAGKGAAVATALKVVAALLLLPVIWIGVGLNLLGIADRLSGLPGISEGGGIVSGIVALVYVAGLIALVSGAMIVGGGELPGIGGGEETTTPSEKLNGTTATSTPTDNETAMPTTTPTTTVTTTPGPKLDSYPGGLEGFELQFRDMLYETYIDDELVEVPVLATEYEENDEGDTVLWVVYRECDNVDNGNDQRINIANSFSFMTAEGYYAKPDRIRGYAVSDLENWGDYTWYAEYDDAKASLLGSMEDSEYFKRHSEVERLATNAENETAYQMAVEDSGQELADEAFYDDHLEPRTGWCSGDERNPPGTLTSADG